MGDVDADGVPADLLGVVDAMLEKAIGASELALASAEREASFIVDRAMADGAEMVRRAGLDPAVVPTDRSSGSIPRSVVAPPTAAELWRTTRRASAPSPSATRRLRLRGAGRHRVRPMAVPPRVGEGPVATLVRDDDRSPGRAPTPARPSTPSGRRSPASAGCATASFARSPPESACEQRASRSTRRST